MEVSSLCLSRTNSSAKRTKHKDQSTKNEGGSFSNRNQPSAFRFTVPGLLITRTHCCVIELVHALEVSLLVKAYKELLRYAVGDLRAKLLSSGALSCPPVHLEVIDAFRPGQLFAGNQASQRFGSAWTSRMFDSIVVNQTPEAI